jgi:hypothetical protein
MGFLSAKTSTAGDSILIQSFSSTNGNLTVYVQNTGQGIVHLAPTGSVYVNSSAESITQSPVGNSVNAAFPIPIGQTAQVVTNFASQLNEQVTIKVVTTEGTFAQVSGTFQGSGGANHFVVSSNSGTSQVAGTPFSVNVTACYASGSVDPAYTGTVHFTSSDAQAVLPANYQFTAANDGVHTFTGVTLKTAGTQSVTVTDTTTLITGSQSISVAPSAATSVSVSGPSQVTAGGTATFVATAKDTYGNTWAATSSATWGITNGAGGTWPSPGSYTSQYAGSWTVTATVGTASGTAPLTVTGGSAVSFTVSGFPNPVTAGTAGKVTVTAKDQFGNVATGYAGTVAITSSDPLAVLPASAGLTSGVGTFSVTLKTAGTQTITATDTVTSSITGTQTGITVNPASAASFSVTGFPSPITAGTPGTVTVTALDPYGNVATGYTGTVAITTSDTGKGVVLPANYQFTSTNAGIHTFSVTLVTAGTQTITATDTVTSSITGTQTGITVNPAAAKTLAITPSSATITAGGNLTYSAMATDVYGNVFNVTSSTVFSVDGIQISSNYVSETSAGNYTVTAIYNGVIKSNTATLQVIPAAPHTLIISPATAAITAGGSLSYSAQAYDVFGNSLGYVTSSAVFSVNGVQISGSTVSESAVGTYTVTATYSGLTSNSATLQVYPLPGAASFVVTGFPNPVTAGTAGTVTVIAKDSYGNNATGYTGTVAITSSDPSAVLPQPAKLTNGVGTFSVTLKTAGTQTITATDTVTPLLTGSQTGIVVNPAAAAYLSVSAPSSVTSGTAFSITVTAKDAYGNTATGYSGQIGFTSTDKGSGVVLPPAYTFVPSTDKGVHPFTGVKLVTPPYQTITATDKATSAITGTSNAIIVLTTPGYPHYSTSMTPTRVQPSAVTSYSYTTTLQSNGGFMGGGPYYIGWVAIQIPAGFTSISITSATYQITSFTGVVTSGSWNKNLLGNTIIVNAPSTSAELQNSGDTVTVVFTATAPSASGTYGPLTSTVYQNYGGTGSLGTNTGTDPSITVLAYTPTMSGFTITNYPTTVIAGQSFSVTVTAIDQYQNPFTAYRGSVWFTSTDSHAVLPYTSSSRYTFTASDSGSHTFSGIVLKTTTPYYYPPFGGPSLTTITVTDGTYSATTNSITVNSGYTDSVTPLSATHETVTTFTLTFNFTGYGDTFGYATIQLPSSFSKASSVTVTASNGNTWTASVSSGNLITVYANYYSGMLQNTGTVTVKFTTTPSSAGSYQFVTTANNGMGTTVYNSGSDPTVTVS